MSCAHAVARSLADGHCVICDGPPPLTREQEVALLEQEERALADELAQLDAAAARLDLAEFVKQAWPVIFPSVKLEWGPHLDAVCLHVQRQLEERAMALRDSEHKVKGQRLGINIPPRTGKTLMVQVFATAWAWIRWPEVQILCLSANITMLKQSALQFREIINSSWYQSRFQPSWRIRDEQDATLDVGNTSGGVRRGRGFGSQVIGLGCDWMIIDDPHGADDSEREVATAIEAWDTSLGNRINDPRTTIVTLVMQRLRERDLSGHLRGVFDWLVLPMEYEGSSDPTVYGWRDWRTEVGQVLHSRFPRDYLAAERLRLGSYGYAGQMQQRPAPLEGGRIKRAFWSFCRIEGREVGPRPRPTGCDQACDPYIIRRNRYGDPDLDWLVLSLDPAVKKTERGSLWGMGVVAGKGERVFLLDDRSTRGDTSDIKPVLERMILDWRPQRLVVEEAASWKAIVDWLQELCARGGIRDEKGDAVTVPVETIKPYGEWEQRVDAFLPTYEARLVHLLEGAPWAVDVVEEHAMFPNGENDDRIDYLVQAMRARKVNPARQWMRWR